MNIGVVNGAAPVVVAGAAGGGGGANNPPSSLVATLKKILDFIKDKVWVFIKETAKSAKSTFQIGLITEGSPLAAFAGKVKTAIASLGVVALVTSLLTILGMPFTVKEIFDKGQVGDAEGVVRASIDTVMSGADALSDLSGAITSLSALGAVVAAPVLAFFTVIALPLSIAGLGYATAKGAYDLVHNAISLHEISKLVKVINTVGFANKINQVKGYIDLKLGVTTAADGSYSFGDREVSISQRRSDSKVVKLMKDLKEHLEKNGNDEAAAKLALEHMKGLMWRKIAINSTGLVGTAALLGALIASLIVPVMSPIAIPIVGGAKALLGIAKSGMNIGLEKWHDKWYEQNKHVFGVA